MAPSIRQTLHDTVDQLKRFSAIVASSPRGHPLRPSPAERRNTDVHRPRSMIARLVLACRPADYRWTAFVATAWLIFMPWCGDDPSVTYRTTRPGTETIPDRTVGALCPDMPDAPTCQDIRRRRKSDGKNCKNPPGDGRRGVDDLAQHEMQANFLVRFVITVFAW
jgi:hypothetical protein